MEGKGAKPEQNPSFHTLFEAYPAQRNRPVTRSHPYSKEEQETKLDNADDVTTTMEGLERIVENIEPKEGKGKGVVPVPVNTNPRPAKKRTVV